jgi:hypothetical protein
MNFTILLLIIFLICVDTSMLYSCGTHKGYECKRDFSDQRGLTRHRLTCKIYKAAEAARLERRRERAQVMYAQRRKNLEGSMANAMDTDMVR